MDVDKILADQSHTSSFLGYKAVLEYFQTIHDVVGECCKHFLALKRSFSILDLDDALLDKRTRKLFQSYLL